MTDTNDSRGRQLPRAFAADIPTDLAAGRAVELAEIYALDAITDAERGAIDAYVSGAPEAERASFNERVRQARETLGLYQDQDSQDAHLPSRAFMLSASCHVRA